MPLILNRSGTVFLHLPRTGGTWVRAAMQRAGVPCHVEGKLHATFDECRPSATAFTVVRNPLTWYPSMWGHDQVYGEKLYGDINEWVRQQTIEHPGWMALLHSQYIGPGVIVIRTEQLLQGLCDVLSRVDEDCNHEVLVSTPPWWVAAQLPRMRDKVHLTDKSRQLIRESEYEIFDRYYREE